MGQEYSKYITPMKNMKKMPECYDRSTLSTKVASVRYKITQARATPTNSINVLHIKISLSISISNNILTRIGNVYDSKIYFSEIAFHENHLVLFHKKVF